MPQNDRLTQDELREFETKVAARFEAIVGQLTGVMLGSRLEQIEQQLSALEGSSHARCEAVERRIEATRAQTEHARAHLASGIEEAHRDLTRIVLLGLSGTVLGTAALCFITIMLIA